MRQVRRISCTLRRFCNSYKRSAANGLSDQRSALSFTSSSLATVTIFRCTVLIKICAVTHERQLIRALDYLLMNIASWHVSCKIALAARAFAILHRKDFEQMKTTAIISMIVLFSCAALARAQVVSGRAPVIAPTSYSAAASSNTGTRVANTTFYAPQSTAPVTPIAQTAPSISHSGWQPVNSSVNEQVITTRFYAPASSVPVQSAPIVQTYSAAPVTYAAGYDPCASSTGFTSVHYAPQYQPVGYASPQSRTYTFSPLVPIQNLPNGTYIGQGLVGQPKAYVDGQPVRNFFRYVLP